MKKYTLIFLLVGACANQPMAADPATKSVDAVAPIATTEADLPAPAPDEPRAVTLQKQIDALSVQITRLEPQVIAAENRQDRDGPADAKVLRDRFNSLEQKRSSLELQLMSLPEN